MKAPLQKKRGFLLAFPHCIRVYDWALNGSVQQKTAGIDGGNHK
jgi:hypothetical protein